MTQQQIELVKNSWLLIRQHMQDAGELFYNKLFTTAPEVRNMFQTPIPEQSKKLMQMLDYVVRKLDTVETIVGDITKMGTRHHQYGAKAGHYDVVGACLLETMKEVMGNAWEDDLQAAWTEAYTIVATTMMQAPEKAHAA